MGHMYFHPTASNLLLSDSPDLTLRLWDIEKSTEVIR